MTKAKRAKKKTASRTTARCAREAQGTLFRAVAEKTPDALIVFDAKTQRIVAVNDAALKLYGRSRAEFREMKASDVSNEPEATAEYVAQLPKKGGGFVPLRRHKKKDGTVFPVEISAGVAKHDGRDVVFGLIRDISERKKAEETLHLKEFFVDRAPNAMIWADQSGRIIEVNRSACEDSGYSREELLELSISDLDPNYPKEAFARFWDSLNERRSMSFESLVKRKDGTTYPVEIVVSLVDYGGRRLACSFIRDISETKRLRELESRTERMETIGQVAGQVAHDFNNLLAPLTAYPRLIRDELPPHHPVMEYIDEMEASARQISEINQQMLTLGRRGHYNLETLRLNSVVTEALKRFADLPASIELDAELGADLMPIMGGAAELRGVVVNLINNALDAVGDGGRIRVRTENHYVDEARTGFGRIPRGEYVRLSVFDDGRGIDPENLRLIFDPFYSTKSGGREKGAGLGLSTVSAVIKDHGAFLDLESVPGKGTDFHLYFFASRETLKEPPAAAMAGGCETVLVVDDDRLQLRVFKRLLSKLGYNVSVVRSGEDAVEFLRERPQDLLILDMVMPPGIDGTETYRRAREIRAGQKAIIVSGFAESDRVKEALLLGVGAFIKKPLTIEALSAAVRARLDRKL